MEACGSLSLKHGLVLSPQPGLIVVAKVVVVVDSHGLVSGVTEEVRVKVEHPGHTLAPLPHNTLQPLPTLVLVLNSREDDQQQHQLHGQLVHIGLLGLCGVGQEAGQGGLDDS